MGTICVYEKHRTFTAANHGRDTIELTLGHDGALMIGVMQFDCDGAPPRHGVIHLSAEEASEMKAFLSGLR